MCLLNYYTLIPLSAASHAQQQPQQQQQHHHQGKTVWNDCRLIKFSLINNTINYQGNTESQKLQGTFIIICSHICGHPVTMTYDYPRRHVLHPLNKLIRHTDIVSDNHLHLSLCSAPVVGE